MFSYFYVFIGTLSSWTSWSSCNTLCGIGLSNRSRVCINNLGLNCTTKSTIEFSACFSNISCKGNFLMIAVRSFCVSILNK